MSRSAAIEFDEREVVSRSVLRAVRAAHPADALTPSGSPLAPLPLHVLHAVREAADDIHEAESVGDRALREAIAVSLREEGITASADRILITNGAMQALDLCFRALLRPGAGVAVPEPRFFIEPLVHNAGGRLQGFPSPWAAGYRPDWDAGRGVLDDATRLLFVNSPVNPTGYVFDESDVEAAVSLAQERDLWLLSDESYSHFIYGDRRHRSPAAHPEGERRVILVRSFSKDFSLSAWRVGFALLPEPLFDPVRRMLEWSCLCVNRVAQAAALSALTGPRDWIRDFVMESEARARWVTDESLAISGIDTVHPQGGLNLLLGFEGDAWRLVSTLITEYGVAVTPGAAFGAPDRFRLQFGGSRDVVRSSLASIRAAAGELGER